MAIPSRTSIIISSYNQPVALAMVLEAVSRQTQPVDEIIIADDGSVEPSFSVIAQCKSRFNLPINDIVTQEDLGFRKCVALNKAILKSSGQQLLFLDGDVIPPPHWAARHIAAYQPMGYAVGTYIRLNLTDSQAVADKGLEHLEWSGYVSAHNRQIMLKALKAGFYAHIRHPKRPKLMGGNFSADRELLFGVNGFDERYVGYGAEDSDLRNRMNNLGARKKSLILQTLALHLHPGLDSEESRQPGYRNRLPKGESVYQYSKKNRWAEAGLTSHMTSASAAKN